MNVSIGNNDYWRKNKKTDEELKNKFKKTFNFNNDINKFILLLRKGVYLYGYMDEWEKIYEIKWHEKDAEEERLMHSRSNNIKFASYNYVNEVADKLFESFCSRYQGNLTTPMRGSDFAFESVKQLIQKIMMINVFNMR